MASKEKIKLQAVFTKDGKFIITDQNGREFDYQQDNMIAYGRDRRDAVLLRYELEAPHDLSRDRPRINLTFSIPLQAEEEIPAFIQEMIRERLGG